jgi:hypothetical protein
MFPFGKRLCLFNPLFACFPFLFFFYLQPAMKEEDVTDSDIFAHTSGVNTFKCNYSIQSWI